MNDPRPRGTFITFEGGEGAGKSTQVARLRERLQGRGLQVVTTREPGGSPRAELIRDFLLGGGARDFGPLAETMLFAAARADHIERVIRPALARGAVVLCDRFTDSTRVYQGALAGIAEGTLHGLEAIAVGPTRPDLTLVFDLPVELGLERADARRTARGESPDRFEAEDDAYHARIRSAFLAIAAGEPARCIVIDASGTPDAVEAQVLAAVEAQLGLTRQGGGV